MTVKKLGARIVLLVVLAIAASAGLWFVWLSPATSELGDLAAEQEAVQTDIKRLRAQIEAARRGDTLPVEELYEAAGELDELMGTTWSTPDLLRGIPRNIAAAELELTSFAEGTPTSEYVEYQVSVSGQLDSILDWISSLPETFDGLVTTATPATFTSDTSSGIWTHSTAIRFWRSTTPPIQAGSPPPGRTPSDANPANEPTDAPNAETPSNTTEPAAPEADGGIDAGTSVVGDRAEQGLAISAARSTLDALFAVAALDVSNSSPQSWDVYLAELAAGDPDAAAGTSISVSSDGTTAALRVVSAAELVCVSLPVDSGAADPSGDPGDPTIVTDVELRDGTCIS